MGLADEVAAVILGPNAGERKRQAANAKRTSGGATPTVPAQSGFEGGSVRVNNAATDAVYVQGTVTATPTGTQDVNVVSEAAGLALAANQQTDALTNTQLRATAVPVSAASLPLPTGAATAANQQTDALTDTQLRATAVPVSAASLPLPSGAATAALQQTDALTDTQLRATPVPVSGTVSVTEPVSVDDNGGSLTVDGTVAVSSVGGTVAVSGPLTDAQLRASAVPISAASLPLPTGAATAANQQTDALTDTQLRATAVPVSNTVLSVVGAGAAATAQRVHLSDETLAALETVAVTGPLTDAQLRATPVPVDVTVTGFLTDAELRASAVPVSVASLPLPTGASTLAEQQTQTASLSVLDDWDESDRAKVNPIVGQAGVQGGAGAVTALTQRVVIATDQTQIPQVPNRPSQGTGRTHVQASVAAATSDTTIHTVTAGKTLYVTSAWIHGHNDQTVNATRADIQKNDGTKILVTLALGVNVVGATAPLTGLALTFPEPFQYAAGEVVQLNIASDGIFGAGIVGYEE